MQKEFKKIGERRRFNLYLSEHYWMSDMTSIVNQTEEMFKGLEKLAAVV